MKNSDEKENSLLRKIWSFIKRLLIRAKIESIIMLPYRKIQAKNYRKKLLYYVGNFGPVTLRTKYKEGEITQSFLHDCLTLLYHQEPSRKRANEIKEILNSCLK